MSLQKMATKLVLYTQKNMNMKSLLVVGFVQKTNSTPKSDVNHINTALPGIGEHLGWPAPKFLRVWVYGRSGLISLILPVELLLNPLFNLLKQKRRLRLGSEIPVIDINSSWNMSPGWSGLPQSVLPQRSKLKYLLTTPDTKVKQLGQTLN